jgi:hypothetical protein
MSRVRCAMTLASRGLETWIRELSSLKTIMFVLFWIEPKDHAFTSTRAKKICSSLIIIPIYASNLI